MKCHMSSSGAFPKFSDLWCFLISRNNTKLPKLYILIFWKRCNENGQGWPRKCNIYFFRAHPSTSKYFLINFSQFAGRGRSDISLRAKEIAFKITIYYFLNMQITIHQNDWGINFLIYRVIFIDRFSINVFSTYVLEGIL